MGVTSRIRPPLPAPTESIVDEEGGNNSGLDTDVATNITSQTDFTSLEIPDDGQPVTISHGRVRPKDSRRGQANSNTSLLIEYFETSTGDKTRTKPSVRVKVTPSARKTSGTGAADAIKITGIGKDRKASYTRHISLGSSRNAEVGAVLPTATDVSTDSNISAQPFEVEVLDPNASELSTLSRGLMYGPADSNVSSMPPDSMLDGSNLTESERGDDEVTVKGENYLTAPQGSRDRNASRERLTQKVMEKLSQSQTPVARRSGKSKSDRDLSAYASKSRHFDSDTVSGADSSILSSNVQSYRSGSDVSNNPKLLGMVEDTIRRIILPEINAIKEDQKTDRNMRTLDSASGRQPTILEDMYARKGLTRSLSKSSSSPNISSKPKVVLNRDGEDPGVVLSRGDSERKKMRKSSQGSHTEERPSSRRSSGGRTSSRGYDDSDTIRAKSSKSSSRLRDTAAVGAGGALLTGAALKNLESSRDSPDQRKRRSKSRSSRRSSGSRHLDEESSLKEDVPPMPLASRINDSELTRSSLVSDATATAHVQSHTPLREISRGSMRNTASPASVGTPPRTPGSKGLIPRSMDSPKSSSGLSTKERMAALSAAGVGGAALAKDSEEVYDRRVDADGYGATSPRSYRKTSSPMQSVSSLKQTFEDEAMKPQELRPRSAASRSSAGREKNASQASLRSGATSPNTKLARSRPQSSRSGGEGYATEYAIPAEEFAREGTPGTPTYGESVDDWYERQHQLNNEYRHSLDAEGNKRDSFARASNRDSYQTNPYPQDEKRFTYYSEDGQDMDRSLDDLQDEQDVRGIGANPHYVHTPHGAESAVASLILEPSNVSSGKSRLSAQNSPVTKPNNSFSARLRELGKDEPPLYQGSTLSQTMPSQDRWQALKGRARDMSTSRDHLTGSPQQPQLRSVREERSLEQQPVMSASGLPLATDPMPEIGHFDDTKSEGSTNASIVREPLGGDATGKDTWPYTPEPGQKGFAGSEGHSLKSGGGKGAGLLASAAAGGAALASANAFRQASVEDDEDRLTPDVRHRGQYIDREATPTSPAAFRDEGYVTDAQARSAGALTPEVEQRSYSKKHVDEYNRAMEAYGGDVEDPFTGSAEHSRNVSGNSHGMAEPMYDPTTGRNIQGIQSKDIVNLMDHLTVRDAQRNARDTEILVTLVRSAAEMRENFNEMKKFIVEQDRMIMQSTDRSVDQTVQKALGGPRPLPSDSPRTSRLQSQEDIQMKRKGVLRRALKGLTGSKSANDLAKVEGMLMQILDNVEDLKHQSGSVQRDTTASPYGTNNSLDSYERLRNAPDSGYEPEGLAGTSSTPSNSGGLSLTPRGEKQQFHSGYDGRRNSVNRVSTVVEGDEDEELEPHESHVLDHQFEQNDRFSTPTQESVHARGFVSPIQTSPHNGTPYGGLLADEITPRSVDKQRKHRSNGSSNIGQAKVSRWSKTTASSAAPDAATLDSPYNRRPLSETSSRSTSTLDYGRQSYEQQEDDRMRSTPSLARERAADTRSVRSQVSKMTRTPSPLIPSEASINQRDIYDDEGEPSPIQEDLDHELDDPKYQAHRNSLLLQHPQPRQGPTARHQNTLETHAHAHAFEDVDMAATSSDLSQRSVSDFDPATWGSSGTAGLAKHRLSQFEPDSMNSPSSNRYSRDTESLIPQKPPPVPPKVPEPEPDWEPEEPTYSNSGFSRGNYYNSPFGSGHLLEPIEEVESVVDSERQLSPEPTVASAQAVDMRSEVRKITGPRPMGGSRSPAQAQAQPRLVETTGTGTVRRKPVRGSEW